MAAKNCLVVGYGERLDTFRNPVGNGFFSKSEAQRLANELVVKGDYPRAIVVTLVAEVNVPS